MAINFNKRAKGQSKREYAAQILGGSKDDYDSDGKKKSSSSKSSSSSQSSSKVSGDLQDALKEKGAWDSYNKMTPDQQELVKYNFEIGTADSKDKATKLQAALDEATKQADPYWKSFLTVAKDEVSRAFDDTKQEYGFQKQDLETKIAQISEDLTKNRDFYTLEQQSDLAKLKQSYEQQRDGVIEDAANKGLTFSTKKEVPLQQLSEYNANVVESTNRSYAKKQEDLAINASRDTTLATTKIGQLSTELGAKLTSIGRTAEQDLGTSNLPPLEGYNPLGDVSGNYYEKKVKDIADRQQALYDEKVQASLNFNLN